MGTKSRLGHLGAVIVGKPWPRGVREKNLQYLDTMLYQQSKRHNVPALMVLILSLARKPTYIVEPVGFGSVVIVVGS
jgi:hypothetical protein